MTNKIYEDNYFMRDYVTPNVSAFLCGEVFFYFYKETLIGVRHNQRLLAYFLNEFQKGENSTHAPTFDEVTPAIVQEAINDLDTTGEALTMCGSTELIRIGKELLAGEIMDLVDKKLAGEAVD